MLFHCLNSLSTGNFNILFCRLLIFFKNQLFEKIFQEFHQIVNQTGSKRYQQTTLVGKVLPSAQNISTATKLAYLEKCIRND